MRPGVPFFNSLKPRLSRSPSSNTLAWLPPRFYSYANSEINVFPSISPSIYILLDGSRKHQFCYLLPLSLRCLSFAFFEEETFKKAKRPSSPGPRGYVQIGGGQAFLIFLCGSGMVQFGLLNHNESSNGRYWPL